MQFSDIITLLGLASTTLTCAGASECCCYVFEVTMASAKSTSTSNATTLWVKNGTTQAEIDEFVANN